MNIISHQRKNRLTVLQLQELLLKKRTESVRERPRDPSSEWMNSSNNSISTGLSIFKATCHEPKERRQSLTAHSNLVKSRVDKKAINHRYSNFRDKTEASSVIERNSSAITENLQMETKPTQYLNSRYWFPKIIEELKLEEAAREDSSDHSQTVAGQESQNLNPKDIGGPLKSRESRYTFQSRSRPSQSSTSGSRSKSNLFRSSLVFRAKAQNITNRLVDRVGRSSQNVRLNKQNNNVRHTSHIDKLKKRQSSMPSSSFRMKPIVQPPTPKPQNRIKRSRFAFRASMRKHQVEQLQLLQQTPQQQEKELPKHVRTNKKMATRLLKYVQSCQKQKIIEQPTRPETPDSDERSNCSQVGEGEKDQKREEEAEVQQQVQLALQQQQKTQVEEQKVKSIKTIKQAQQTQSQGNILPGTLVIEQPLEIKDTPQPAPQAILDLQRDIKNFYFKKHNINKIKDQSSRSLSVQHVIKLDLSGERRRAAQQELRVIRRNIQKTKQQLIQQTPSNSSTVRTEQVKVLRRMPIKLKQIQKVQEQPNKQLKNMLRKFKNGFPLFFQTLCSERVLS